MTHGVPLIQGGAEAQETAQRMLTAVILCGIIIAVASPVVQWLTGFTKVTVYIKDIEGEGKDVTVWTDDPDTVRANSPYEDMNDLEHALPGGFTGIFDKVIMALRGIAAFAMIVALVWGGIKLSSNPELNSFKRFSEQDLRNKAPSRLEIPSC